MTEYTLFYLWIAVVMAVTSLFDSHFWVRVATLIAIVSHAFMLWLDD